MNRVEVQMAIEAAAARVDAVRANQGPDGTHRTAVAAMFAGTDLPAFDVMDRISYNATEVVAPQIEAGVSVEDGLRGIGLNMFLFGFECGRRSK